MSWREKLAGERAMRKSAGAEGEIEDLIFTQRREDAETRRKERQRLKFLQISLDWYLLVLYNKMDLACERKMCLVLEEANDSKFVIYYILIGSTKCAMCNLCKKKGAVRIGGEELLKGGAVGNGVRKEHMVQLR